MIENMIKFTSALIYAIFAILSLAAVPSLVACFMELMFRELGSMPATLFFGLILVFQIVSIRNAFCYYPELIAKNMDFVIEFMYPPLEESRIADLIQEYELSIVNSLTSRTDVEKVNNYLVSFNPLSVLFAWIRHFRKL